MIIDSHVHIASHDTERFPLRPLGGGGTTWWQNPVAAEDLLAAMDAERVDRAVVVHAFGAYSFDCRYTIAGAKADPARLAAVVAVDMAGADPVKSLRAVASDPVVRGVRLFAARPEELPWIEDPASYAVWDAAGELGLTIVLVALGSHLDRFGDALRHATNTVTVIDHCGLPELEDGHLPADSPLIAFADLATVVLKVSTPVLAQAASSGSPRRLIDQLVGTFGVERVLWGSDYPQTREPDYRGMVALAREATAGLSSSDQDLLLAGNSARLWFQTTRA